MNNVREIRNRLDMSQADLASAIGVTQGNVSHIEQGRQVLMPAHAKRLIEIASERGVKISFDDIYHADRIKSRRTANPESA